MPFTLYVCVCILFSVYKLTSGDERSDPNGFQEVDLPH